MTNRRNRQTRRTATPASRWLVLTVMCVGYFLVLMDVTIVNVALPQIGAGLEASVSGLQWVVDGYALALAALLLAGGTIGDLRGHKPIVLTGLTVFGIASAACGLAPSTGVLIASRVVPVYRDGTPIATVSATAQPTTSDTAATRRDILRQLTDSGTVLAGAHVGPLPSPPVAPRDEPR